MKRQEVLAMFVMAFLMLTAGLTWRFGWLGLACPPVVMIIGLSFVKVRSDG